MFKSSDKFEMWKVVEILWFLGYGKGFLGN